MRNSSSPCSPDFYYYCTMNNRGVANHFKFKTKYWQERQKRNTQNVQPMVMGVTIALSTLEPPALNTRRTTPASPHRLLRTKQEQREPKNEKESSMPKWVLKKQLLDLSQDNFSRLHGKGSSLEASRSESGKYRGRSSLSRYRRLGVSFELCVGSEDYRLQQRFSVVQRQFEGQFLPLGSSRSGRIRSPLF